jgi:hypothetical protein
LREIEEGENNLQKQLKDIKRIIGSKELER